MILWLTLVALNVLDVVTTGIVFSQGGYEANPLLSNNLLWTITLKVIVLGTIYVLMRYSTAWWIPSALLIAVVWYSGAVAINVNNIIS